MKTTQQATKALLKRTAHLTSIDHGDLVMMYARLENAAEQVIAANPSHRDVTGSLAHLQDVLRIGRDK